MRVPSQLPELIHQDEVVGAGLLHDTPEDTPVTLGELREDFGDRVAGIVQGCTEPGVQCLG
jgi:(p)ppGpp synthase/HD superfamily hydrolase